MTIGSIDNQKITEVVDRVIAHHGATMDELIPILNDVNKELGYLPGEALKQISKHLHVPRSQLFAVSSFYQMLHQHIGTAFFMYSRLEGKHTDENFPARLIHCGKQRGKEISVHKRRHFAGKICRCLRTFGFSTAGHDDKQSQTGHLQYQGTKNGFFSLGIVHDCLVKIHLRFVFVWV